jgi:hypothetical protein
MSSAPQSRRTFKISDSLNRQLNTYAQVASGAGVSVLALAGASEAKVIYTETYHVTHEGLPLYIDLNHDGIKDFLVRTTFYVGTSGLEVGLAASGYPPATLTTWSPVDVLVAAAILLLLPSLCRPAPESDRKAISPFVSHLWQWSFSTVSAANLPL